jgi:predicted molibdopterin-dependent oxidoreductase YjgC
MFLRYCIELDSPCHGNGSCHKCRVTADGKQVLACAAKARDGMRVVIPKMQGIRFRLQ